LNSKKFVIKVSNRKFKNWKKREKVMKRNEPCLLKCCMVTFFVEPEEALPCDEGVASGAG
jgi:hypothetical protein